MYNQTYIERWYKAGEFIFMGLVVPFIMGLAVPFTYFFSKTKKSKLN